MRGSIRLEVSMAIDLNDVMNTVNKLKMVRASLDGRKEQLQSQLKTQILPEFEKLGVTVDTIESTIAEEEKDITDSYNKVKEILLSVNANLDI